METKELKIQIPEGYEIDKKNSTFEKIVFKKKNIRPRSWEEYCEQHNATVTNRYFIDNGAEVRVSGWHPDIPSDMSKNTVPSKELAEAFLAMMQLMSLRKAWIGDWKPNDSGKIYNYCIVRFDNKYIVESLIHHSHPLSFPTDEMSKDFMDTFKGLLEIAKPLI